MLLLQILCDARKFCALKNGCRIGQRDIKMQYMTKKELALIAEFRCMIEKQMFYIYLLQQVQHHSYQLNIDATMLYAMRHNCLKLIKFLIRYDYVKDNARFAWGKCLCQPHIDDVLFTIMKTSLQKGRTLRDIYGKDGDLVNIVGTGQNIKTVKLMFKHGFDIATLQTHDNSTLTKMFFDIGVNHHCLTILQILFKQGVMLENFKEEWQYALDTAVASGKLSILKFLFANVGLTWNNVRSMQPYALKEAKKHKFDSVIQFLRIQERLVHQNDSFV